MDIMHLPQFSIHERYRVSQCSVIVLGEGIAVYVVYIVASRPETPILYALHTGSNTTVSKRSFAIGPRKPGTKPLFCPGHKYHHQQHFYALLTLLNSKNWKVVRECHSS